MPVTHTLQAAFTQSIGKGIILPAGAKSMFFFGTGFDNNNGNRVTGGPVPVASGAPVYSTNYVTVGYNGTTGNTIDTMNPRTPTMLAAGWTWAIVYRSTIAGSTQGLLIEDAGGGGSTIPLISTVSGFSFQQASTGNTYIHSNGTSIRATLIMPTTSANWHFLALTYTGGAAGTYTLNQFTDNIGGGTAVTFAGSAVVTGTNSPSIGGCFPNDPTSFTQQADVAWAYVGQGSMLPVDLAALAASVRPWLARRGVVM